MKVNKLILIFLFILPCFAQSKTIAQKEKID